VAPPPLPRRLVMKPPMALKRLVMKLMIILDQSSH
jgi:hypothetical protein